MLDASLKAQLASYLERISQPVELVAALDDTPASGEMRALLEDIAQLRDRIAPIRRRLDILYLQPGPTPTADARQARLQDLCAPTASSNGADARASEGRAGDSAAVRLDELVVLSPYEEGPTLDLVRQMLETGALVEAGEEGSPPRSRGRRGAEPDAAASAGLDASDLASEGDRDIQRADIHRADIHRDVAAAGLP